MAEFKIVISRKDGKSEQKEVKDDQAKPFLGRKIGDIIKGDAFGMPGFEFQVCGGSDSCGFPMRKDVTGTSRKRILAVSGVGLKRKRHGQRQRKTVCGNTIHGKIAQINLKITKEGKVAKPEEAKEEQKPDAKSDAKPESKPDVKPKEEQKPESKPESKPDAKPESKPDQKPKEEQKSDAKPESKPDVKPKEEQKPEAKKEN